MQHGKPHSDDPRGFGVAERGPWYRRSQVMLVEGKDLVKVRAGSGEVQEIGETLGNSVKVRELRKLAEVKEESGH